MSMVWSVVDTKQLFFPFSLSMTVTENLIKQQTFSQILESGIPEPNPKRNLKAGLSQHSMVWYSLAFSGHCHHKSNQSYNCELCVSDDRCLWVHERQASATGTARQTMSLSSVHRVGLSTWTLLKQRAFIWYPPFPNPQASVAMREVPSTFLSSGTTTAARVWTSQALAMAYWHNTYRPVNDKIMLGFAIKVGSSKMFYIWYAFFTIFSLGIFILGDSKMMYLI